MTRAPTIRAEIPSDVVPIQRVLLAAFPGAAEAGLVDSLRMVGRLDVSLVAEIDTKIIGHIAFSPVSVSEQPSAVRGIGLAPLAVDPTSQRQGIGAELVRAGLNACRDRGDAFVVVLGEPAYYSRFGFQTASRFGLQNEYCVDEPFMVLELTPGALSRCRGLVRYCAEFASLE